MAVWVQQGDGSWRLSGAILTRNFSDLADPATAPEANARPSVGFGGESGVGLLTVGPGACVVAQDVNGIPVASGGPGSTGNPTNTTSSEAVTPEEVRKAQQALPACQQADPGVTLQQVEEEAAAPTGIQC
jgi:hypothetical protein